MAAALLEQLQCHQQKQEAAIVAASTAWLPQLLPALSGGAAIAAVCSGGSRSALMGRAFVERLGWEAAAVQGALEQLDEQWRPDLIEPCVAEG